MADNKKSFVLYVDLLHTVEKLTDEEAGRLFKHILEYVNDKNPEADRVTELVFEPIKRQFKRDLKKWEGIKDKRSEAGKKGANKRWQNKANAKKDMANIAVNDNVNVNDNVINKEKNKKEIVKHWNEEIGVDGHLKK